LKHVKISGINVGESPKTVKGKKEYANLRAEIAFSVRDMFVNGMIDIDDEELAMQAAAIEYDFDKKESKFILEKKENFRSRYGRSPDEFDCLLIAKAQRNIAPSVF